MLLARYSPLQSALKECLFIGGDMPVQNSVPNIGELLQKARANAEQKDLSSDLPRSKLPGVDLAGAAQEAAMSAGPNSPSEVFLGQPEKTAPPTSAANLQGAEQSVTTQVAEAKVAVQAIPDKLLQAKADTLEDLIRHNKISKCDGLMKELVAAGRVDLVEQAMAKALGRNDTPVSNGLFDRNGSLDIIKKYEDIAGPTLGEQGVSNSLARIGSEAIYDRLHNGYKNGSEERLKQHLEKIAQFCFGVNELGAVDAVKPIAEQVVDRYRAEGFGAQADRLCKEYGVENKPRASLAGELRQTLLDPNYGAEDKAALIKSLQMRNDLSRSDMRTLLDEALKGQEGMVAGLSLEQSKKLQAEIKAAIDPYSGGIDLARPGRDFEDALDTRVTKLEKVEAQRQQAEERQAREAAEKARQEQAKLEAANRAAQRADLEGKIGDILVDPGMSAADKVQELKRLQKEGKLSDQGLRDIVGKELKERGTDWVGELSRDDARKLSADMKVLDDKIGNGILGLWENNDLQS
ncbi:MAG: hypothetical protein EBZ48_14595, partial [Proteobacteria bacterium]|nr:hypothetical protein [Pseudomonadota bacterium]